MSTPLSFLTFSNQVRPSNQFCKHFSKRSRRPLSSRRFPPLERRESTRQQRRCGTCARVSISRWNEPTVPMVPRRSNASHSRCIGTNLTPNAPFLRNYAGENSPRRSERSDTSPATFERDLPTRQLPSISALSCRDSTLTRTTFQMSSRCLASNTMWKRRPH
jgi:hypothetical protein